MRLGMSARREIYQAHYRRYQKAGKSGKGKIPDELTGTAGLNRDHLAHVLASCGKQGGVGAGGNGGGSKARRSRRERAPGKRGGRPPKYQDPAFLRVLARIGEDHGRPCGKLLAAMVRGMTEFPASSKEPDCGIADELKALLAGTSGAQIDRLPAPARKALELRG
jgi:hypothetical protein